MASNINPQNIDGAYPVAGQDNDSQGFRDNFTNTRTNFSFAAAEITDLQNKAVLKAALDGTVLNNDMGGSILSNAQLQDTSETRVALGTVSGAQTINYAAGPYYTLTTFGSVSIAFTNFPPAGQVGRVRLQISVASTAHTLTLPATVSVGTSNIQGYSANIITFNQTGTFEFEFETNDSGSTITIIDQNRNLDPIYLPSSEDLAASAAANLSLTTSFFTTAAAETATLAAGSTGQVKILAAANVAAGDMVITVSNAGWKASGTGTITFDDIGQTATLIYINSKWYVIGQGSGASNTLAQLA
jgi:hypothetical protein